MKPGATYGKSVALAAFLKDKTGGVRPARRHTFVRQQKYAKVPSPCGGHLLCRISVSSKDGTAQEAGPLPGGLAFSVTYGGKALKHDYSCSPPQLERLSRASGPAGEM